MYMPPNSAEQQLPRTLKLLVNERRGPRAPRGLDLAFATPRAWLDDGATIDVRRVRTSFGLLSFSMKRSALRLEIDLTVPRAPEHARLRLRLPPGTLVGTVRLGARRLAVDRSTSTLVLPRAGRLHLVATLRSRSAHA
jgi:hypothetical protein